MKRLPIAKIDSSEDPSKDHAAAQIRGLAHSVGFAHVALAPVEQVRRYDLYAAWLAADRAGEMSYLHRDAALRQDPRALLAEAQTIVCVALSYQSYVGASLGAAGAASLAPSGAGADLGSRVDSGPTGQIARYARGEDYHLVLKRRLAELARRLGEELGGVLAHRICVDSAPLLEREVAARAGLGFQAKNTLLITPGVGSYTVLGELLLSVAATPGEPIAPRCGACQLCLTACPTGALVDGYMLDARRCISYLTIECTGAIPRDLRPLMGTWIFGCDLCQEVCPWNAAERLGDIELSPRAHLVAPELAALLRIGAAQFRRFVRRSALRRIDRAQLLRNVAVALGNAGTADEVPALCAALHEPAPLVRGHVAWALGRIASRDPGCAASVRAALSAALLRETDAGAAAEIAEALGAPAHGDQQG